MKGASMKSLILAVTLLIPLLAGAKEETWTVDELRQRFQVRGEMYRVDTSGKRLLQKNQNWQIWKPSTKPGKIESQWSSVSDNYAVIVRHTWEVQDDGTIKAVIEHFGKAV